MMVKGQRIKSLREIKGLTQQDLADALGVNRSMVAKYEADASMTLQTLIDLCKILETHPDYLLGYSDISNVSRQAEKKDDSLERDLLKILAEQIKMKDQHIKRLEQELK